MDNRDELYQQAVEQFGSGLARLVCAYEVDPDLRRDLSQEIQLALWRSLEKFSGRCSLRTWTYRVAHNVATSHVIGQLKRKEKARAILTLDEAEGETFHQDLETSADRREAMARLVAMIGLLDPVDRQVIVCYLEGMDAESVAEITGLSVANIWTKIHRIKASLARRFQRGERNAK